MILADSSTIYNLFHNISLLSNSQQDSNSSVMKKTMNDFMSPVSIKISSKLFNNILTVLIIFKCPFNGAMFFKEIFIQLFDRQFYTKYLTTEVAFQAFSALVSSTEDHDKHVKPTK